MPSLPRIRRSRARGGSPVLAPAPVVHELTASGLTWVNVVAACKRCNHFKQNRTPEEAGMELLALPFEPNPAEYLALMNSKRIRADQMDFLKAQFSRNCRLSMN